MFNFSVYDPQGVEVDRHSINDDLTYVEGRIHRGKNCYYKGVGVPYKQHNLGPQQVVDADYDVICDSSIIYMGPVVSKRCFVGKTGVFQELYQPFYPDFIGSCSIKEGLIVINSLTFEKSSVEVFDCIEFDAVHQQHYYELDYKCGRQHYVTSAGQPHQLRELVDFMLQTDWNFLWDKQAINDITADGRVSDVADLFQSNELKHKLGTVYAVLYSLGNLYPEKYQEFLRAMQMSHDSNASYVLNSMLVLRDNNIDISPLLPSDSMQENYMHIVRDYLLQGKNCAHCACDLFQDQGDLVRDKYLQMLEF